MVVLSPLEPLMFTLALVVVLFATNLLITTLFLWLGVRLVKAPKATVSRAVAAVATISVFNLMVSVAVFWARGINAPGEDPGGLLSVAVLAVTQIGLFCMSALVVK